jgi:hypothetical protein
MAIAINLEQATAILISRFTHRRLAQPILFNHSILLSRKIKYPGITFHQKHVNNIAKKISARISDLYLLLGYYSTVLPVISFQLYFVRGMR